MRIIYICICLSKSKNYKKLFQSLKYLKKIKNYKLRFILLLNGIKNPNINQKNKKYLIIKTKKKMKIPQARNFILKKLRNIDFSYAGLIDDDCYFKKDWLLKHFNLLNASKKFQIVSGPQISKPYNIYHDILEPTFKHGTKIKWCPTNNVFFESSVIKKNKIFFDNDLKNIGGSDQLFFHTLNRFGFNIIWNKLNPVFEHQEKKRLKFEWFMKRNLRYSSSGLIIDKKIYGKSIGSFLSIFRVFYYLIFSIFYLPFIFLRPKFYFLKILQNLIRIVGRLKAFFLTNKKYI